MDHDRWLLQSLGRRIKELRLRAGLTQQELAERSLLATKYISELERGQRNPTLATLYRVCRTGFSISLAVLFFGVEGAAKRRTSSKVNVLAERQPRLAREEEAPYFVQLEALLDQSSPQRRAQLLGLFGQITEMLDAEASPSPPKRRIRKRRSRQTT